MQLKRKNSYVLILLVIFAEKYSLQIKKLAVFSHGNHRISTHRVMASLMSNELAIKLSWTGKPSWKASIPPKRAFKCFRAIVDAITRKLNCYIHKYIMQSHFIADEIVITCF